MGKMTRRSALLAGAAVVGLAVWQPASAQEKGTIYYMIPTLIDEFQTETQKTIESVFGGMGYTVVSVDAENQADRQFNQMEDVIALKPDAIIIAAVDFDSIIPAVEKARAAGIKVMAYDRTIKGTEVDLTSVAGTVEIGRLSAEQAIRLLTERYGSAKGKLLQILGDPGDNYTLDIQKGFEEVMAAKAPDVQLITHAALQWEPTNAAKIADDQLW